MIVEENFISDRERIELGRHAVKLRKRNVLESNDMGPFRYFLLAHDTPYNTSLMKKIGARVVDWLGIETVTLDPLLGWVISYIEPGGEVQLHRDDRPVYRGTEKKHLRCNVVVAKESGSGNPIIEGESYNVNEKAMWAFYASDHMHGSELVTGNKPRIIYQFGFLVEGKDIELLAEKGRL